MHLTALATRCFPPTMDEYTDATYGDRIVDVYDDWYADLPFGGPIETTVGFLRDLAGGGPALELGIGTGRVALPLSGSGVTVRGIDASEAIVARLASKPGGAKVQVTVSSFADFDLADRFPLIYVAFNTFFALRSQDEQVSCFAAVARHLLEGGVFVMEAFVPDLSRYERGQFVAAAKVGTNELRIDVAELDNAEQRVDAQHLVIVDGQLPRVYPVQLRFAYHPELDLMARLAGMRLRERWGGWDRTTFTGRGKHISVWELDR
jgi:hypothetical protein